MAAQNAIDGIQEAWWRALRPGQRMLRRIAAGGMGPHDEEAKQYPPLWATSPDVVGSARRTLELWPRFARQMNGINRALVLQDGIGDFEIPWGELSAVFIGGSDAFKASPEARHAAVAARMLGKSVHVGRVNTYVRAYEWAGLADSYDGSGISRDPRDEQLSAVLAGIWGAPPTMPLFDET